MFPYSMIFAKLGLGLLALILQINLLGKRNLAPTSALDQIQNYVLGGIIGGVIYNDTISIFQFLMIMVVWTILVMILKYLKSVSRLIRIRRRQAGHPHRTRGTPDGNLPAFWHPGF